MSVALLLTNNLDNSSKGSPAFLAQLHLPTHDLFRDNLRVQLQIPPLRSLDLLISPGTCILPSTTAVFSYAIGSRKLSANEQFFVGVQTEVSLLQRTQIISDVRFITAHVAYAS